LFVSSLTEDDERFVVASLLTKYKNKTLPLITLMTRISLIKKVQ